MKNKSILVQAIIFSLIIITIGLIVTIIPYKEKAYQHNSELLSWLDHYYRFMHKQHTAASLYLESTVWVEFLEAQMPIIFHCYKAIWRTLPFAVEFLILYLILWVFIIRKKRRLRKKMVIISFFIVLLVHLAFILGDLYNNIKTVKDYVPVLDIHYAYYITKFLYLGFLPPYIVCVILFAIWYKRKAEIISANTKEIH
jgi:hypothetical protein